MAGLCWMTVGLALLLSAGNSLAAVDQTWLTSIIEGIKDQYPLGNTFSLVVNIPQNQNPDSLQEVLKGDSADKVKQAVSQGQVYQGSRVVAAAQPEALSRVLEKMQPLIKSSQGNFLLIYSEESPCGSTCKNTNEGSIARSINDVTQNWRSYAFVFSKVAAGPVADSSQLAQSFKQLTISKLGLENLFRCYEPGDDDFQCTSCSSGGGVTPSCLANTFPSNQEQGEDEETGETEAADVGKQVAISKGEVIGKGIGTGVSEVIGKVIGAGISEVIGKGIGRGASEVIGKGIGTGVSEEIGTGIGTGVSEEIGTGIGTGVSEEIGTGIGKGVGEEIGTGKGKVRRGRKCMRKRKGRRGRKCRRGGRRKGGKVRKGRKRRGKGKVRRGRKGMRKGKGQKWGKRRGGNKRRGGSKRRGGNKRRGGSKRRGGNKRRGGSKRRGRRWEEQ